MTEISETISANGKEIMFLNDYFESKLYSATKSALLLLQLSNTTMYHFYPSKKNMACPTRVVLIHVFLTELDQNYIVSEVMRINEKKSR